jgi:adenylate cyclase
MIYRFSDCELDTARFELRRNGVAQKVEPQVFEILRYLLEQHGQFVAREELHKAIWHGRVVSDAAMSSRIKAARRAIGDSGVDQRMIRTVHGRGFSFVAPVVVSEQPAGLGESTDADVVKSEASSQQTGDVLLHADVHLNELLDGNGLVSTADADLLSERGALKVAIERSGGRIVADAGGGICARFGKAVDALECAADLQRRAGANPRAGDGPSHRPRIAICELQNDLARSVAIAGRLQCCAAPGEICITGRVRDGVRGAIEFSSRPVEGGLERDFTELGLSIVEAANPSAVPTGIPQLQCGSPVQPREPSIVLLPFEALGSDTQASELAEGLRIDIQNGLIKIARILLIAVGSANAFRGKTPEFAATSLGVRYVLHGVVQMAKKRARISLELVDTLSAHPLWAEQFNIKITDTFAIQDDITRKVIAALDVKLYSGEQARIWHQALTDPNAVRMFYRGVRLFFAMEHEAMANARRAFEAVTEMRPESSIGATWVALSHWFDHLRRWSSSRDESKRLAKRWAETATSYDDVDGQAHTVLAHTRLMDREFDAAIEAGRQAVTIRPGCANANGFFGNVLHYCGQQAEAIAHIKRSIRLQPVYPPFLASMLATSYLAAGQVESALAVGKEALRLNPRDLQSRLVLLASNQIAGNRELARIFASEVRRLEPEFSVDAYSNDQPYRDHETIDAMVNAWLASGLPP